MAKCYLGELLYGEMLLKRVVIWRNVIWRDVTEPKEIVQLLLACSF